MARTDTSAYLWKSYDLTEADDSAMIMPFLILVSIR